MSASGNALGELGLLFYGAGVGFVVDFSHVVGGDVGVDLGGDEVGVAEEFLDGAEVGAVVEEVGGEGVAQGVRAWF